MVVGRVLETVRACLDRRARVLSWGYAVVHFSERVALVAAAIGLSSESSRFVVASACLLALAASRALLRTAILVPLRVTLYERAVDALLSRRLLAPALLEEDTELAILSGVEAGADLGLVLPELVADGAAAVLFGAAFLATSSAHMIVVGFAALFTGATALVAARRVTAREHEAAWEVQSGVIDHVVAAIDARLELVANGAAPAFRRGLGGALDAWRTRLVRAERVTGVTARLPLLAAGGAVGAAILFDAHLRGGLTLDLVMHAAVVASALPPLAAIAGAVHRVASCSARFAGIQSLLAPEAVDAATKGAQRPVPSPVDAIRCRALRFTYPEGARAALDVDDVVLRAGAVTVLAGANGSGKSTCLRLLLSVTRAYEGEILIGDAELGALDRDAWHRAVAYLPQRPYLATRSSVREAVTLLAPAAKDDATRAALERVKLWATLVARAPDDPLGALVSSLSAGERQRLALARLLVADKPVLVLDEPDANLDAAGVVLTARLLRELGASGKIVAVAAHADEILAAADVAVWLEGGRVARVQPRGETGAAG